VTKQVIVTRKEKTLTDPQISDQVLVDGATRIEGGTFVTHLVIGFNGVIPFTEIERGIVVDRQEKICPEIVGEFHPLPKVFPDTLSLPGKGTSFSHPRQDNLRAERSQHLREIEGDPHVDIRLPDPPLADRSVETFPMTRIDDDNPSVQESRVGYGNLVDK
jgi:hypothetical protein